MVVRSNIWGGRFDKTTEEKGEEEDDDDDNYDRASYKAPINEEVKQGWLLKPPTEVEMIRKRKKKRCNMDPPLIMKNLVVVAILVAVAALIALLVRRSHHRRPSNVQENYTIALHAALKFFNAQKSGKLPPNNNVSWRGDSCLNDGNRYLEGLEGGYYDGGDAVKYSFPTSFAMTLLSWSLLEYSARYEAAGELDHVKDIIRWGTNYLLKTFDSTGKTVNEVASQVGQTSKGKINDGNCWIRPERIDYARPVIRCSGSCPALAAEMAAALAAASIVFKDDNHYSQLLVHGATMLFNFATNGEGQKYSGGPDPPSQFYNSSGFWDEFVWGGAWLYCATGHSSYLDFVTIPDLAKAAGAFQGGRDYGVFSWDNKLAGAQLVLSRMRLFLDYGYPYEGMLKNFHEQISYTLCSYLPDFHNFNRTSGGLIQLNHGQPRPLQYAVNAAFLAVLYSDYLEAILIPGWTCGSKFYERETLRHFAMTQINYILGRNPQNMSYVVGFGHHFPKHVHHKGASVPRNIKNENCQEGLQWRDSKKPNPNTIVGAMVSGPDKYDGFQDNRANFNYTEPTISGNAGLVAALVALSDGSRAGIDKNSIFYAIPPFYPPPPPPPPPPSDR